MLIGVTINKGQESCTILAFLFGLCHRNIIFPAGNTVVAVFYLSSRYKSIQFDDHPRAPLHRILTTYNDIRSSETFDFVAFTQRFHA